MEEAIKSAEKKKLTMSKKQESDMIEKGSIKSRSSSSDYIPYSKTPAIMIVGSPRLKLKPDAIRDKRRQSLQQKILPNAFTALSKKQSISSKGGVNVQRKRRKTNKIAVVVSEVEKEMEEDFVDE